MVKYNWNRENSATEVVLTFSISTIERSLRLCVAKPKHPARVQRAGQKYDEIWSSSPFVCGKTWLRLKKCSGWRFSMRSQQAENRLSMADYFCVSMKLLPLSVCSMPCNRSRWSSQAFMFSVQLSTCKCLLQTRFVYFSAINLTLWVPSLFTNRPPCRKKSILAKVCFDAR